MPSSGRIRQVECVTFAPTDVDDGDTVTDYMDQVSRARFCLSKNFNWK